MALEMLLFVLAGLAVVAGCLIPNRYLPRLPNDKFMHFTAYALLSLLALRVAATPVEALFWLVGLLIAGWLVEVLQLFVSDRGFCWRDIGANAAGIATAGLVAQLYVLLR